jgi:hypothetical protein
LGHKEVEHGSTSYWEKQENANLTIRRMEGESLPQCQVIQRVKQEVAGQEDEIERIQAKR